MTENKLSRPMAEFLAKLATLAREDASRAPFLAGLASRPVVVTALARRGAVALAEGGNRVRLTEAGARMLRAHQATNPCGHRNKPNGITPR